MACLLHYGDREGNRGDYEHHIAVLARSCHFLAIGTWIVCDDDFSHACKDTFVALETGFLTVLPIFDVCKDCQGVPFVVILF